MVEAIVKYKDVAKFLLNAHTQNIYIFLSLSEMNIRIYDIMKSLEIVRKDRKIRR